jgi:hypothetical protein
LSQPGSFPRQTSRALLSSLLRALSSSSSRDAGNIIINATHNLSCSPSSRERENRRSEERGQQSWFHVDEDTSVSDMHVCVIACILAGSTILIECNKKWQLTLNILFAKYPHNCCKRSIVISINREIRFSLTFLSKWRNEMHSLFSF